MPPMIYRRRCLTQHPACVPDVVQIAVSSRVLPSATVHGQKKTIVHSSQMRGCTGNKGVGIFTGPEQEQPRGDWLKLPDGTIHNSWALVGLISVGRKVSTTFCLRILTISQTASHPIDGSSTQHLLPLTQPPASSHHQPRSSPPFSTESSHLPPCTAPTNQGPPSPVC